MMQLVVPVRWTWPFYLPQDRDSSGYYRSKSNTDRVFARVEEH
jgi:hypothetical protein